MVVYTLWCSVVPVLFVRVPCDSREQHCSSCRFPGKSPYSSLHCWFHPVSASEQLTVSPHRLSDHSLGNHLRACGTDTYVWRCLRVWVSMCACKCILLYLPWESVPGHAAMLSQDSSAQIEQDVVETLLLCPLGCQFQDLCIAMEQPASIACGCCRLHFVPCEDPNLHTSLVQGLNSVGCFVLQPET